MRYFIYCRKSSEAEDRQVLSIASQKAEITKNLNERAGITVVEVFEEARSAKAPGRTVFDAMIKRIERGDADGILAWHPDRLARNSVDGGRIIYLLDQGHLKDLRFATFTFENNPQGKFMLSIIFGYSKYYVDSLSENVKRGNRTKIENGWWPNMALLGYLNDKENKTIVEDPDRFALVRRMWHMLLNEGRTPRQIWKMAREEWGLTTIKRKKIGGAPIALSHVYRIFGNSFYAGKLSWGGAVLPGKHPPMITMAEFRRAQLILGGPDRSRPQRHTFAFTGLIRCGACGLSVTAEHKINRFGSRYVYYHCSRRNDPPCKERSIEAGAMDRQILAFLATITIPESLHAWSIEQVAKSAGSRRMTAEKELASLRLSLEATEQKHKILTDLRLRELVSDGEFVETRDALESEASRLRQSIEERSETEDRFEPEQDVLTFLNRAISWYQAGDDRAKRLILETVGSNPCLKGKKLSIEAKRPFVPQGNLPARPYLRAVVEDVRTLFATSDAGFRAVLANIRVLKSMHHNSEEEAA